MPNQSWHSETDLPVIDEAAARALLTGTELPADAAAGLQPVADVLRALRAGPTAGELAGESAALTEFRQRIGMSTQRHHSRRRRHPVLTSLLSAKAAAAAAIAALSLGGVAAAAVSGSLPGPAQRLAHDLTGAPSAKHSSSPQPATSHSAVGPDATGSPAYGLCNAYSRAKAHGSAKQKAVAFRNLAAAAGGAGNVAAYCAAVPHPGSSGSPRPHRTGQPASHPNGRPPVHPTGKAQSHPGPRATPHPTPSHPTGKPAS